MPDCDYCGESFEDDQSYLAHLEADHEGELGSIDRRRVETELESDGGNGVPTGPAVLGIVLVVAVLIVGYVVFVHGSSGGTGSEGDTVNGISVAQMPGDVSGTYHEHGHMTVRIDGEEIDFSRGQYQLQADEFHFENGNDRVWHKHAPGVTLEYAMATLGIDVSERTVTVDGTTYRDSDAGTNVSVTVDGEPVDPATYELQGTSSAENAAKGDDVRIVVTTDG